MSVEQYEHRPFSVTCDECGEQIGSEDYGGFVLFDTRDEAERAIPEWKWRLVDGVVTCESCMEEERLERSA